MDEIQEPQAEERTAPVKSRPERRRPRRWVRWLWLLLPVLCATILGVGYVLVALKREPEFYRRSRAALQDQAERQAAAAAFESQAAELESAAETTEEWRIDFTEEQVNAWLWEEFPRWQSAAPVVREPLVDLTAPDIRLGVLVDLPQYEGVASVRLRPRVESGPTLVVAVEDIRAGELPIPAARWIGQARAEIERRRWPVRIEEEPTLRVIVDLAEIASPWSRLPLTAVDVGEDRVTLIGGSPNDEPGRAQETE